jgi:hypothetical protein
MTEDQFQEESSPIDIYEGDPLKEQQRGRNWLEKIAYARNYEAEYRRQSQEAFRRYSGSKVVTAEERRMGVWDRTRQEGTRRNVFYSNVDALRSLIMPDMPTIKIQKRAAKEESGELAQRKFYTILGQVAEQTIDYFVKNFAQEDFDDFKLDWLISGRGVLWVNYCSAGLKKKPSEDILLPTETKVTGDDPDQQLRIERVHWSDFVIDPKAKWQDVKWVGRRMFLNYVEFKHNFPQVDLKKVTFHNYKDVFFTDFAEEDVFSDYQTQDSFISIWEIWDRNSGYTLFLSDQYEGKLLKRIRIRMKSFFLPTPPPLLTIRNGISMVPISEYWLYKSELDELSAQAERSDMLIRSMTVKGYAEDMYEPLVRELNKYSDNFISSVKVALPPDGSDPIHFIDNRPKEAVLKGLADHGATVKDTIYEITGITEAMRAMAADRETAASILKKNEYGTARLRKRQNELNNYLVSVFKIMFLMVKEWFDIPTLQAITSMNLRNRKEIQADIYEIQQAQAGLYSELIDMTPQGQGGAQPEQPQTPQQPGLPQRPPQAPPQQAPMQMQGQPQQRPPGQPQQMQGMGRPPQGQPQQPQQPQNPQQDPKWLATASKEQQMDEKIQKLMSEVSWEDVIDFFRTARISEFAFEISTEFNQLEDIPKTMQMRTSYLQTFIQTLQAGGPIMMQDPTSAGMITKLLDWVLEPLPSTSASRGEMQDYLQAMLTRYQQMAVNPPQQPPNPDQIKAQAAMMIAQAKTQEAQVKAQKVQADAQASGMKTQADQSGQNTRQQMVMQADAARSQEKIQADAALEQAKMQNKQMEYQLKMQSDAVKERAKGEMKLHELELKTRMEMAKLRAQQQKHHLDFAKVHLQHAHDTANAKAERTQQALHNRQAQDYQAKSDDQNRKMQQTQNRSDVLKHFASLLFKGQSDSSKVESADRQAQDKLKFQRSAMRQQAQRPQVIPK